MKINEIIEQSNTPKLQISQPRFKIYEISYSCSQLEINCFDELPNAQPSKYYDNSLLIETLNLGKQSTELHILNKAEKTAKEFYKNLNKEPLDILHPENYKRVETKEFQPIEKLFCKKDIKKLNNFFKSHLVKYSKNYKLPEFLSFVLNTNQSIDGVKKDYLFFLEVISWLNAHGLPYIGEEKDYYQTDVCWTDYSLMPFLRELEEIYSKFVAFQNGEEIELAVKSTGMFLFKSSGYEYDLIPYTDSVMDLVRFQLGLYISNNKGIGICKKCKKLFSGNAKKETCSDACRKAYSREKKKEMGKNGNN